MKSKNLTGYLVDVLDDLSGPITISNTLDALYNVLNCDLIDITYCCINGIKDTSRGNLYHNKRFKAVAESHGLIVEHDPKYGWTITHPSDDLLDFILETGLTDILITRNDFYGISVPGTGTHSSGGMAPIPPKPSNSRKYICPCCGNSVRATKVVHIACVDCREVMVLAC